MKLCPRTCRPPQSLSQRGGRTLLLSAILLALSAAGGCSSSTSRTDHWSGESVNPQAARLANLTTADTADTADLSRGLTPPARFDVINARCPVPADWVLQPLKEGKNHKHLTWISPTGRTAYGVIYASLPFPAGIVPIAYRLDKVFEGFMNEMKRREGRAELIDRQNDYHSSQVHFVAEGAWYRLRVNLVVRGAKAWFIYAAGHRGEAPDSREMDLAERARDQTQVGEK
jgi:hypothetical protein